MLFPYDGAVLNESAPVDSLIVKSAASAPPVIDQKVDFDIPYLPVFENLCTIEVFSVREKNDSLSPAFPVFKLSSFKNRYTNLENFLSKQFDINFSIVELNDDWGPGALDEDLDAIIVSEETEKVASELNKKRALKGLNPLDIVTVSLILDKKGEKISSTRIRNSEIDREGNKA